MSKKPNIVIIYTDQQRKDSLGCYGNELIQTPHIDALASEGTTIKDCHVSCPICVPSRVAFWSGRYGANTGSLGNQPVHLFNEQYLDMASHFRSHGYTTGLIGKNHCFPDGMMDRAFDHSAIASHGGFPNPSNELQQRINDSRASAMQMPYIDDPIPAEESITHWCFDQAEAFIKDQGEKPFLCWLSVPDPHPPFMVSEPYASMYDEVIPPSPIWDDGQMDDRPFRHQIGAQLNRLALQYPNDDIQKLWRIYWGMVSQIDDGVGRLMKCLDDLQLNEDTIVIYTSDHGDFLGDHRMIRKGTLVAPCLTAVPLIFRWPGKITNQHSDALVSNIDLFPTLCDLAEIPEADGLQGFSLASHLSGQSNAPRTEVYTHFGLPGRFIAPDDPEVQEMLNAEYNPRKKGHPLLSNPMQRGISVTVRNHDWTYTRNLGEISELYDRKSDPHEQWNLADQPEHAPRVSEMKDKVYDWLATVTMGAATLSKIPDIDWKPKA